MSAPGPGAGPDRFLGRPHLSVVLPAFDEEFRLGESLERIGAYLSSSSVDAELLVVDDGSSDGTARIASEFLRGRRGRVLRNGENRGKGFSVRRGVLEAEGRWVLVTDADLSAPIQEHAKLAEAARDGDLDVAIGSRALADSQIEVRQHRLRETMGKTFNRIVRLATSLPFHDTQCGFKLLHRERCLPIVRKMVVDGFAFDVELLVLCQRFGLKVREIPVVWRNDPASKVGFVGDPARMLYDVGRVLWRFRRGLYNPDAPDEGPAGRGVAP